MGFWNFFLRRVKSEDVDLSEQDWEKLIYDSSEVDFSDNEQRRAYVTSCLEQADEASKELNKLNGEYALVTSYLTDIEEIEALPSEEREVLNNIAKRMLSLNRERERYHGKKNRMKDSDYYHMRQQEDQVQEGIEKLKECEGYGDLIRQDMQRLDRERHAYTYRRAELDNMMGNFRGMSVIFLVALCACVVMLLVLQYGFRMRTGVGYAISVGSVAVAITVLWVRYTDAEREKQKVEKAVNKLIQLQNKVKIRYVNNRNLQEYLCIKYNTDSAAALEKLWKRYLREKEERKEFAEAEAKLDYYREQLLNRMSNYRVQTPDRWINRPGALVDKREVVEMRHELILQRQTLRKQMEYNNNVIDTAKKEIMGIVDRHPSYAAEILALADQYEDV